MEDSTKNKVTEQINSAVPLLEKMLATGFPIDVKQTSPGVVEFTKDNKPLNLEVMDVEALKFYINTMIFFTYGTGEETGDKGSTST
jgi:hypothetical protein